MTIKINGVEHDESEFLDSKVNTHKDVRKFLNNLAAFILGCILVFGLLTFAMLL